MTNLEDGKTLWGIHGGRYGEAEELFKKGYIALGWDAMGDMSSLPDRETFKSRFADAYPEAKAGAIPTTAGQLYRFVREVQVGDFVAWPTKSQPKEIWLGEIIGEYSYEPSHDYPHVRRVKWIQKLPRTRFSQGALYEIGSAMSFFLIKSYADEFLTALSGTLASSESPEEETVVSVVADEIEQQSRDFVLKQLSRHLKGHPLAEFVGHLLDLIGYKTKVSPPGPDLGIDVVAYKDDLGAESPIIQVQVKSEDAQITESTIAEFYGKLSEREFGLFVGLGGFKKAARVFAQGKPNLRLFDGDDLVDLVYKYYGRLDGKYKAILPLRVVYLPETLEERSRK